MNENNENEINNNVYNCVDENLKLHQKFNMSVDFVVFENFIANFFVSKLVFMSDNLVVLEDFIVDRIVSKSNFMKILKIFFDSFEHIEIKNVIEKTKNFSKFVIIDDDSTSTKENFFVENFKSRYSFFVIDKIKNNK